MCVLSEHAVVLFVAHTIESASTKEGEAIIQGEVNDQYSFFRSKLDGPQRKRPRSGLAELEDMDTSTVMKMTTRLAPLAPHQCHSRFPSHSPAPSWGW